MKRRQPFSGSRTQEAVTLSMFNAGCLLWWTYLQFVTAYFFGLPFMEPDSARMIRYYAVPEGMLVNVPTAFFAITVVGVTCLALGTPILLANSRAKFRQIFLLAIFSVITLGFSFYMAHQEEAQYQRALRQLELMRRLPDHLGLEPWHISRLENEIAVYEASKR